MMTGNIQLHDDRGHQQVVADRVAGLAVGSAVVEGVLDGAAARECRRLSGAGRKRRSSAKTVSATTASTVISPIVSKPRKSTRMTLTTLRAAAFRVRVLEEVTADRVGQRARHDRVGERRQAGPDDEGDGEVASAAQAASRTASDLSSRSSNALGQPAQAKQDQDRGHDLDEQLGQREIGGGEPDEGDAGDQPGAAQQHERDQPVILGLVGGADRAAGARPARPGRRPDRRCRRPGNCRPPLPTASGTSPAATAASSRMRSCGCSRRVPSAVSGAERPFPATVDQARARRVRRPFSRRSSGGPSGLVPQVALERQIEHGAADQRHRAHDQRQVEAMPDREAVMSACGAPSTDSTAVSR